MMMTIFHILGLGAICFLAEGAVNTYSYYKIKKKRKELKIARQVAWELIKPVASTNIVAFSKNCGCQNCVEYTDFMGEFIDDEE